MKKFIVCAVIALAALVSSAAQPTCSIEKEFWGHQYLKLTDVNGRVYKLSVPAQGSTTKYVTKTGWYVINSEGVIVKYQDKVVTK